MDSEKEAAILVHHTDGSVMKSFSEFNSGLYYYDADKHSNPTVSNYYFTQTVENNKQKMFHHRKIEGAQKAKDLYEKIGRPSEKYFQHILANHLIRNCPETADDAKQAIRPRPRSTQRQNDQTQKQTYSRLHRSTNP